MSLKKTLIVAIIRPTPIVNKSSARIGKLAKIMYIVKLTSVTAITMNKMIKDNKYVTKFDSVAANE